MRIFRPLQQVRAISFDLDDTLYDNRPVMAHAEQGLRDYLSQRLKVAISPQRYLQARQQALHGEPRLADDVSRLRRATVQQLAQAEGWPASAGAQLAEAAFDHFLQLRNQVTVPAASHQLLAALAKHYPLIAISNGNVDAAAIGLAGYFCALLRAGDGWPMKPARPLFREAERLLGVHGSAILHVGDHAETDVYGALTAGWQAAWIDHGHSPLPALLPTLAVRNVTQLASLLLED